ncbi:Sm-like ribonucleoprotein subunit D2 [Encephalitozoon hellem ATCC 50504]|uniref:Small nuclear ribonucleoprotein Sm D2 n=1 Tax=Encephalitozoon hellem TaxID=27973 RepID=A0A9Q9FAG5_ENCHE|nr:Sm-like ribonucleoprotein subunit D2 [Encephalitozoon hellem ATCC 50504]AFM99254.1 Sm-like ribonucleoprotein subunit D2 [Encephalitozoon hellem ATCC 50504]UTX44242.1 small nuclear ribonucleoprotein D2 [Encephalitozoon hellem]WEL39733.1 small nuclear ribonucleoprotein D2 [Encephalitozoon hellem]|eukprot:XP_003888235.1 Sm-like ribonucleoprotein subunit D2 [Encephalitozoon hellem ATCC 50504]
MFLPKNLESPNEKEAMEMKGPLSLVHRAMVKMMPVLVSLRNNRKVVGKVIAYDRHYNLLMEDAKELGTMRGKNRGKKKRQGCGFSRRLGNVFIRGDTVILVAGGAGGLQEEGLKSTEDQKRAEDGEDV